MDKKIGISPRGSDRKGLQNRDIIDCVSEMVMMWYDHNYEGKIQRRISPRRDVCV